MLKKYIKKHVLIFYFFLCFSIMIIFALIQIIFKIPSFTLYYYNLISFLIWVFMVFSPTIAAVMITGIVNGVSGIKKLLKGFLIWNVNYRWYLAAFLLILVPLIVGFFYSLIFGDITLIGKNFSFEILVLNLIFTMVSGPISEEAGWRGFVLPRLESRYNAINASLILGIIWTFWHLPLYFIPGSAQSGIPFPIYMILVVSIGILITWAYNNTRGSLLITMLFHFCFNFGSVLIVLILNLIPYMINNIVGGLLLTIYLILVIKQYGIKKLSLKPDEEMPFLIPNQDLINNK